MFLQQNPTSLTAGAVEEQGWAALFADLRASVWKSPLRQDIQFYPLPLVNLICGVKKSLFSEDWLVLIENLKHPDKFPKQ